MTKLRITLLVLAVFVVGTLTPTAARAIINYEEGATFIFGRQQLIVREDGWWDGQIAPNGEPYDVEGPTIEVECDPSVPEGYTGPYIHSIHHVMTPKQARVLAWMYEQAADAAEAP